MDLAGVEQRDAVVAFVAENQRELGAGEQHTIDVLQDVGRATLAKDHLVHARPVVAGRGSDLLEGDSPWT